MMTELNNIDLAGGVSQKLIVSSLLLWRKSKRVEIHLMMIETREN